ncbi:MAG: hypothetical protein AAF485_11335 [Chloroflexota bacterium]
MKTVTRLLIGLFLLAIPILTIPIVAQEPIDANVEFFVSDPPAEESITVGDQITLRLEVTHPSDSRIVLPQTEEEAWAGFTVVEQTAPETVDLGNGQATTGRNIVVSLFQPGQYQTPLLVVVHRKPDGSIEELGTPVVPIQVTSVLTDDLELRNLKDQADLPLPPAWPWVVLGIMGTMFLLALLAIAGYWFYSRFQQPPVDLDEAIVVRDTRPPEVIAYEELDRIETLSLPTQNRLKEHYSLISNCLRLYIEGRYDVSALERTSYELRTAFRQINLPSDHMKGFMNLLTESDFVKFARYSPPAENVDDLIEKARAMIEVTTPDPEIEVLTPDDEEMEVDA